MKVSEYIEFLQDLKKKHGDVEVMRYGFSGVREAPEPELKHRRILSKRESRPDYWEGGRSSCTEANKGEKVIAI